MRRDVEDAIPRIADALERIADALEGRNGKRIPVEQGVVVRVDSKEICRQVVRYTLHQAAASAGRAVGGPLIRREEDG